VNEAAESYYTGKDHVERLKQKKADLTKILNTSLDRVKKKMVLQQEKLREVSDRDKLRLYGELTTANIYSIAPGATTFSTLNYYSENGEYMDIPLDPTLSPQGNAQKYYKQYSKAKSAYTNTTTYLQESLNELEYLESVIQNLVTCETTAEIAEIRQELVEQGYILKKSSTQKKKEQPLPPVKYVSSDGFEILAGRNNLQNDRLTLKTAGSNDIWLHTRNIPGSHVIIRAQRVETPPSTLLEAAEIAAFHSKAAHSSNVPVDYTRVKNVKKPPGSKPGMVIYENFKTLIVSPDEDKANSLRQK
jgi:predicted ribosome quality control (RQC) complex YloA/Tae2 family protein